MVSDGQFEFFKIPFGLSNLPAVLQRHVRAAFYGLMANGAVLVYLHYLIVPDKLKNDCIQKLR